MTRSLRHSAIALAAVLAVLATAAFAAAGTRSPTVVRGRATSPCLSFRLGGRVAQPLRLTTNDLRRYPVHSVDVTFQAGSASQTHHEVGALLTDVVASAGPSFDPAIKNDALRFWVQAVGSDDYSALVSWGEIDPSFGARPVLLSYEEDGADLCASGPRLIVPGDIKGGRDVSDVVRIRVGRAG
jgi:hypothetical protein